MPLLQRIRKIVGAGKSASFGSLRSTDKFEALLDRERARAERTASSFSLVTLKVRSPQQRDVAFRSLAQWAERRLRLTDEAGWLDEATLGIILPDTSAGAAWQVADDLLRKLPAGLEPPECRVYQYPSDAPPDEKENDGDRNDSLAAPVEAMDALFEQPMPMWKRTIDVAGAAVGLLVLSPLLLATAAAVKLSSPGPVFFRQWRSGRGGRPFVMYKFRSMVADAEDRKAELMALNEQDGPAFKIAADPRVTRLGRLLRKTSIDELPQLINVLRGEMSLVGPRPLPCHESAACTPWQRRRLDVTPGITCIWQSQGGRLVAFDDWMRMDMQYIRRPSLRADVQLLWKTVFGVISRKVRNA